MKNTLKILVTPEKGRVNSFWYDGIVAEMGRFLLMTAGETKVSFKDNGPSYNHKDALRYAKRHGLMDKDLKKPNVEFSMGNWFTVVKMAGQEVKETGCEALSTYKEGLREMKKYYRQDQEKKQLKSSGTEADMCL
jgi:hypothetical protein